MNVPTTNKCPVGELRHGVSHRIVRFWRRNGLGGAELRQEAWRSHLHPKILRRLPIAQPKLWGKLPAKSSLGQLATVVSGSNAAAG